MSTPTHRYYFDAEEWDRTDGEGYDGEGQRCMTLDRHLEELEGEVSERRLYPAVPIRGTGDFYCTELGFHGQRDVLGHSGNDAHQCGQACDAYEPRNGRNGCCRHRRTVYEPLTNRPAVLVQSTTRGTRNWVLFDATNPLILLRD